MLSDAQQARQVKAAKARFKTPMDKARHMRITAAAFIRKAEQIELEFSTTPEPS
jgi:hypothetical protein